MKKSLLALILALVMTLPVVTSCGDDKQSNKKDSDSTTDTTAQTEVDEEAAEIDEYVNAIAAENNFDGETFTMIGREDTNVPTEEEITGDVQSDAFYQRQRDIEELFGVDWVNVITEGGETTRDMVNTDVKAGTGEYDIAHGNVITVGQPWFTGGVLTDLSEFEILDISQEWWVNSMSETHMINGKLYFVTGSIVQEHFEDASCVIFNKEVAENYNISGLYDLVKDGEWTVDKMFEVAEVISANTDGNGTWRYGYPSGYAWLISAGLRMTQFDEDGTPYVENTLPTALSALADKMTTVFGDDTLTAIDRHWDGKDESVEDKYGVENIRDLFVDNRVLFQFVDSRGISELREEDVEFGILPIPVYNKGDSYASYANSWAGSAIFVPKSVKNVEKVDAIVEAMGALSQKYVKPAIYDKILQGRSTYDTESREMLDIIFNTKVYDLIDLFEENSINTRGQFSQLIENSIINSSGKLASGYASAARLTNMYIKQRLNKNG